MLASRGVTPPNRPVWPCCAKTPIAVEEVHAPQVTTAGPDDLGAQLDDVAGLELLAVVWRGDIQPCRGLIIVVNDHRD